MSQQLELKEQRLVDTMAWADDNNDNDDDNDDEWQNSYKRTEIWRDK